MTKCDAAFSDSLWKAGLVLNDDKKEMLLRMFGSGSFTTMKGLFAARAGVKGKFRRVARYLGTQIHQDGWTVEERKKRINAAMIGWSLMGKFWTSSVCIRFRRIAFHCVVYTAAISGLEANVMTRTDMEAINKLLLGYGRRMLKGKACRKAEQADGSVRYESISNQHVWKYIGCVPVQIELRVRRLKWLQELVAFPENNKMVIAALLGTMQFEKSTPVPNPWADQMLDDIKSLHTDEEGEELCRTVGDSIVKVFLDEYARGLLLCIDVGFLRAQYWTYGEERSGTCEQKDFGVFACDALKEDGTPCGKEFPTYRALKAHQNFTVGGRHGERDKINRLTVTNQCMLCSSTFASRIVAMRHVAGACKHGRCITDRAVNEHELIVPDLKCPECEHEAPCLSMLQRHIVSHMPTDIWTHDILLDTSASLLKCHL